MINFIYYDELKIIWGLQHKGTRAILETEKDYIDYAKRKLNIRGSIENIKLLKKYYKRYKGELNELLDV